MGRNSKIAIGVVVVLAIVGLSVWGLASGGDQVGEGAGNPD